MSYKSTYLALCVLALVINSINARSIETNDNTELEIGETYTFIRLPVVVCIIGIVAVVASGGFCLFSSRKKEKRMSKECLTSSSSTLHSTSNTPTSSNSEVRELNTEPELEEVDISVKVDEMNESCRTDSQSEDVVEPGTEPQKKRRSFLDALLNRNPNKKERRKSNMQIVDDRSLNSISTNEDWINEQRYQAEINHQKPDDLYDEEDINSNDGFWNSDLVPVQSSSEKKQELYAVPSLGSRNSVIIKGSEKPHNKRQSVIIVEEDVGEHSDTTVDNNELKPPRVVSWKNSDLDKELKEIFKNIDEQEAENEQVNLQEAKEE